MSDAVLVVDDEPRIRRIVELALADRGYRVLTASSAEEADEVLAGTPVDAVVTDLQLPGRSGLELMADIHRVRPTLPVILITAFGTVETAVEALKAGAYDYVLKPFSVDELEALVAAALETGGSRAPFPGDDVDGVVAASPAMARVLELVRQVAPAPSTVLITGETGVGKEVVARLIHRLSGRGEAPFTAVNCAAIPGELLEAELFGAERGAYTGSVKDRPGRFEIADGGTLFLDEIGDMPLSLQPKLLRVLQEGVVERLGSHRPREVDVRVLTATHQDLEERVRAGDFREDLYYRINVFPIHVPPLRERVEDVDPLARLILEELEERLGARAHLTPEALERLRRHPWPGNVRELRNALERAVLLTTDGRVKATHLPEPGRATEGPRGGRGVEPLADAVARAERDAIQKALDATGDNKAQAAKLLGVSVRTLFYKIEKLGMR